MKTPFGPDLRAVYDKLSKAKEWFSRYKVEAIDYYSKVLTQGKHIRSLLTSIPSDQQKDVQSRLIFECQVVFIFECTDLLIDLLIHEKGRVQQEVNKIRAKVENHILKNVISSMRNDLNDMHLKSSLNMEKIHALANPAVREKTKARMELLRKPRERYHLILQVLDDLTKGLTEGVIFHEVDAHKLFLLAKDKNSWRFWSEKEKQSFVRNPDIVHEINNENEDVASIIAIDRIVDYIKQGKITFKDGYYYQDIGDKIKNVEINERAGFLTSEILEELVSGKFVIDIKNRIKELNITDEIGDGEPDDDDLLSAWINFSDVMQEVSQYVRATNTEWFKEHELLFRKQTNGLFSIEYNEKEFAERLYKAIGFLGRNFRYRDSEEFWNLKYFIQRYLTEEQLILELKFIHRCMASFENKNTSISVIDTIGVNSRKKSILSNYHGRYNTIGFSDMRSVTPNMIPINSFRCHSTDSEAMNIVSVMDKIQTVCDGKIEIYTGDAHTVSRISAGMVFLSHGVVAAGRICHEPKKDLGEHKIGKLTKIFPS